MKRRSRFISVLLAILVLSLVLVGCSTDNSKTTKDTAETETNSSNEEAKNEDSQEYKTVKGNKVITVGVAADHKPWCYMNEDKEIAGLDVEILKEAAKRMGGYTIEFEVSSFDGMFGLLDAGKVDTVAQQITITPARLEKYDFSKLYAYNPYKLVVRKNDDSIKSVKDLKGKTFNCQPNGFELEFIKNYKEENDPNDEINVDVNETDSFIEINLERADAALYPVASFEQKVEEGKFDVKLVGDVVYEENNAFPFKKDADPAFVEAFNEAILSMHEDGTLTKMFTDTFGIDLSKSGALTD